MSSLLGTLFVDMWSRGFADYQKSFETFGEPLVSRENQDPIPMLRTHYPGRTETADRQF
jgi:hypothetical protein